MNSLRPAFTLLTALLLLASCSDSSGVFRMEGRFKNLNQGEFFIYNAEQGWKDTIAVNDGRFTYQKDIKDTTLLMLVFPNYSELPIVARPGVKARIEGDASHLRATEVKGSEENEELTAFRLRVSQMTPPEAKAAAGQFINDKPQSPVSFYLLQQYFIFTPSPDYQQAAQLCQLLLKAHPDNGIIVRLQKQLNMLAATAEKLPSFTATDMKGGKVGNSQLKSDINIVAAWAAWNNESKNILHKIHDRQKKNPDKISVVSIMVDANNNDALRMFRRDSIGWPNVCDGKMWQSPLMQKMGFAAVPTVIIADHSGKIVAHGIGTVKQLEEELDKLLNSKK